MQMKLDGRFKKTVQARFERFTAQVGILDDRSYQRPYPAKKGLARVEGGPARKKSPRVSGLTVADVGEHIRKDLHVPYLQRPFERNTREMKNVLAEVANLTTGKTRSTSKLETALRKLVREPILKQSYGRNVPARAKVKTFNRFLFDTGQFFRAIMARVRVKRVQS